MISLGDQEEIVGFTDVVWSNELSMLLVGPIVIGMKKVAIYPAWPCKHGM